MNYISIIILAIAVAFFAAAIGAMKFPRYRHVFQVPEGCAGPLYRDGLYVRRHNAGRKVVWGFGWTISLIDLRRTSLLVGDQEVLTADHVGLKLGALVTYQVSDPVRAAHETQNWLGELHNAARLALRTVVGGVAIEALLEQRLQIGAQLLARTQPEAARIGLEVLAVEVRDVMLAQVSSAAELRAN